MKTRHFVIAIAGIVTLFLLASNTAYADIVLRTWRTNKIQIVYHDLDGKVGVRGTTTSGDIKYTPMYATTNAGYKNVTWWFKVNKPVDILYKPDGQKYTFFCRAPRYTSTFQTDQWTTIYIDFNFTDDGYEFKCAARNGQAIK